MPLPENWPAALDSLSDPGPATTTDEPGFELSQVIGRLHSLVEKLEARFGTGAANGSPVANQVYGGTGTGTAGYRAVAAADISPGALPALLGTTGVLGALSASFTCPIPATYQHLLVEMLIRSTYASTSDSILVRFNNIATATYYSETGVASFTTASATEAVADTFARVGTCNAASNPSTLFSPCTVDIPGYRSTTADRQWLARSAIQLGIGTGNLQTRYSGGVWDNTAVISSLVIGTASGSIAAGSIISVYGLP